ncbi:MAG TPA: hypothetical protein VJB18_07265 [Burkholderiales bacterium]|nr:hypothetical protein [Burkholderiales bacterium]
MTWLAYFKYPDPLNSSAPELWVNMQAQYDLWAVRRKARPKVKSLVTKKAA